MSFLKRLFRRTRKQINIAIIGLDNAGKTTLLNFLIEGEPSETIPTMGVNYQEIKLKKIKLNLMDLGGQVAFRKFWKGPIQTSQCLIFVIDGTDVDRFEEARLELCDALDLLAPELPVLILVNKSDLKNFTGKGEIIDIFNLNELYNRDWHIENTSALLGNGLTESFHWLYEHITGKKVKKKLIPEDILIFNKSGIPIISKSTIFKESVLTAGILSAINSFVSTITNENLTSLTMGKYKVIFKHMREIIGAIILNSYENEELAENMLHELLEEINNKGVTFAEQVLTNFILTKIKNT